MRTCLVVAVCLALLGCGTSAGPAPTVSPKATATERGLDDLIASLKDSAPAVRQKAALDLKKKGAQAKPAIPALVDNLKHTDQSVRQASAEALVAIGRNQSCPRPPLSTSTAPVSSCTVLSFNGLPRLSMLVMRMA